MRLSDYFFAGSALPLVSFAPSITSSAVYIFIFVSILAFDHHAVANLQVRTLGRLVVFRVRGRLLQHDHLGLTILHLDRDRVRLDRRDVPLWAKTNAAHINSAVKEPANRLNIDALLVD